MESHGAVFQPADLPPGAIGVWTPFPSTTEYFNPSPRDFMFNLVVDNLDDALKQVVEGGATLAGDVDDNEFGRFGWFMDPEGNKVELWQPPPESIEG